MQHSKQQLAANTNILQTPSSNETALTPISRVVSVMLYSMDVRVLDSVNLDFKKL